MRRASIATYGLLFLAGGLFAASDVHAESIRVWPDLAPGEKSANTGEALPPRAADPTVTRVINVRKPTIDVYRAEKPNGVGVVILPGGGFRLVVPDKEGSEAAEWLNSHGITCFVVRYRTNEVTPADEPVWKRPLQDTQRSVRLMRSLADEYDLDASKIGLLAFSAGGQVGAIAHTRQNMAAYDAVDAIDELSCQPDFAMLIYPWRIYQADADRLIDGLDVTANTKPTFIVHTSDDASTAAGAAKLYIQLKNAKVPAELHIYEQGGHGYGIRGNDRNFIGTWPRRADDWLKLRGLVE